MKPILFNTEKVRAILDGRKTVTRRVMKPQPQREDFGNHPFWHWKDCQWAEGGVGFPASGIDVYAPYRPGDILYVRETWNTTDDCGLFPPWPSTGKHYMFLADAPDSQAAKEAKWRPSVQMPKEAARIFLKVTGVRVERLQDITEDDVFAEGAGQIIDSCKHMDFSVVPPELCYNTDRCFDCIMGYSYPELFGTRVWDKALKKKDFFRYCWAENPWVWVIEFERVEAVA